MTNKSIPHLAADLSSSSSDQEPASVPVTLIGYRKAVMMTRQQSISYEERCRYYIDRLPPFDRREEELISEIVLGEWRVTHTAAALANFPKSSPAARPSIDRYNDARAALRSWEGRLEFIQSRRVMRRLTVALNQPAVSNLIH